MKRLIITILLVFIVFSNALASGFIPETIGDTFMEVSNTDVPNEEDGVLIATLSDIKSPADKAFNELTEEEKVMFAKAYQDSIIKAVNEAAVPIHYCFPTLFKQKTMHPIPSDYFGVGMDSSPIFKVDVDSKDDDRKNTIALTFDSAYINKYTYKLLDVLDKYNAKCTFFMTYEFMSKNPTQVMEIVKRGHEIGNHSTTHPDFNLCSDQKIVKEVVKCHNFLLNLIGVDMCLFRFPYGSYSARTCLLLKNMGYYPIQWTYDSVDWKPDSTKQFLINRITGSEFVTEGAIILFHNGATYTVDALPDLLEFIINEKGLKPVKVSDMIYDKNFYLINGHQKYDRLGYEAELKKIQEEERKRLEKEKLELEKLRKATVSTVSETE